MLLTDPQNLVKQTLMENGINKLCVFFGKQKANDILLSHVITFLNDKEDKELRGSFYECIVGVAAYVGWHSSPILMPLLQQGLSDPEEFVTTKAINAMATLTELGLLHKSALYQLLSETMVFVVRYCQDSMYWINFFICNDSSYNTSDSFINLELIFFY